MLFLIHFPILVCAPALFYYLAKSQAHLIYIHGSGLHLVPITCDSVESVIKTFIIL